VVPARQRLALVRVFQEALRNSLSHGQARRFTARLGLQGAGTLAVELADDGSGFDEAGVVAGRGLAGIRRRAQELGGSAQVRSAAGSGTRIQLTLSLEP
jgi:signal transduction histidine kinase